MRLRNTLMALILLAGLGAFIYYYEYLGEEEREKARTAESTVMEFERDQVEGLTITRPGSAGIVLEKEPDGWRIGAPLEASADPEKVESILSSLGWLRIEETIEAVPPADLAGFGLKDPVATVTLKLSEGKGERSLSVGESAPLGKGRYAMRPGSPDVLIVSGALDQVTGADTSSLRYRKVVGIDTWKVARFRIQQGGRAVTVARGTPPAEEWRLENPISFPADGGKVQGLWFDIQSAEAESFTSEHPGAADLERFGLSRPAVTLTVEAKEGAAPVTVAFGTPSGDEAFARRSDRDAVMKVRRDLVDKLVGAVTGIEDLRDGRAAPVDRFKLSAIETRAAEGPVHLVKDEDKSVWRWGDEEGPEMPSEKVNALLDAIEGLKAEEFLDGGADVGPVETTLTLREGKDETARSVTVKIGGEGEGSRRVSNSATSSVYVVPAAAARTLMEQIRGLEKPAAPAAAADPNVAAGEAPSTP